MHTRTRWFITLIEGTTNAIVATHIGWVGASKQRVAHFGAIACKTVVADSIVGRIDASAGLGVARIVGARNVIVAIHGSAGKTVDAIARFDPITRIAVVALRVHRTSRGCNAT